MLTSEEIKYMAHSGEGYNVEVNDRVVITNPGGLISSIPPEKFGTMSRTRNPLIFGLFERIRLVEYVGSGVMRMRESMKEEQLPAPDFGLEGMFNITLMRPVSMDIENDEISIELSDNQNIILKMIVENKYVTARDIGEKLSITERQARSLMQQLKEMGYIDRIGSNKAGYWKIKNDFL